MARTARTTKITKPPAPKARAPRTAAAAASSSAAKPRSALAKRQAAPARNPARGKAVRATETPAAKISKDDLRAQVEKLERANETLRAKNRDANRTAKTAAARIAELEDEVAQLRKQMATAEAKTAKTPRARTRTRDLDPGDAVPPGVAVEQPAPLDEQAETALENLEAHLAPHAGTDAE
jgi:chromosome segregation ATPase